MRILHFSDFHLNGEHIDEAKFVLDYMKTALAEIKSKHKIDLVLFSGDMLDQGGRGFDNLKHGFEKFHKVVITPIMEFLDLSESHFIFTPGNHDIDRKKPRGRCEYIGRYYRTYKGFRCKRLYKKNRCLQVI